MSVNDANTAVRHRRRCRCRGIGSGRHPKQRKMEWKGKRQIMLEEQVETLTYQRVASLLLLDDGLSSSKQTIKKHDIVVIPSLVSLAEDFFLSTTISSGSTKANVKTADHSAWALSMPRQDEEDIVMERNQYLPAVTLQPRPAPDASSFPATGTDTDYLNITFGHTSRYDDFQNKYTNHDYDAPSEDWPVGPQGAPIPSHLFIHSPLLSTGNEAAQANACPAGDDDTAQPNTAKAARDIYSIDVLPQSVTSPPSAKIAESTCINNDSMKSVTNNREQRQHLHQLQRQIVSQPPLIYINAVKFLDHAVTRLENRLSSPSLSGSGDNVNTAETPPPNQLIEELEASSVIRLVEMMLHPPTIATDTAVDSNCSHCWGEHVQNCSCHEVYDDEDKDDKSSGSSNQEDDKELNDFDRNDLYEDQEKDEDLMMTSDVYDTGVKHIGNTRPKLRIPDLTQTASLDSSSQYYYPTVQSAKLSIQQFGKMIPQRRVCQYAFKRNDIVWVCRTCQSDETCVLCHECFRNSNHEGHDVAFYHAQAGGCCDCGDEDAWSPSGFCGRHGGPLRISKISSLAEDGGNSATMMMNIVKPAVFGGVRAIADYLVKVVLSGVEEGYRRANPSIHLETFSSSMPFKTCHSSADITNPSHTVPIVTDDASLPDFYDNDDGGWDRRLQRNSRNEESFLRRNTVADVESTPPASLNMFHEAQFNPLLASTSSSSSRRYSMKASSGADGMNNEIFDPVAARSSPSLPTHLKSISTSLDQHDVMRGFRNDTDLGSNDNGAQRIASNRSPARALGDLGREEHGLFLVLHCDDIHIGSSSSSLHHALSHSRAEVIAALKELYLSPGGSREGGDTASSCSGGINRFRGRGGEEGGDGGEAGNTFWTNNRFTRQPDQLLLSPTRYSLFRAPQAEAVLDRIVQIVKSQGDIIVWGTQEIIAECGDVASRLWRFGDPHCSTLVGAAILNRAKILTDRGLVCSIKTLKNLCDEQTATAALRLIGWMAASCDPLCDQVSLGILGRRTIGSVHKNNEGESALMPLLRNDLKLPHHFVTAWHSLLLTLLAVPNFKAAMANTYCETYREVTSEYSRGVGLIERSSYTLSVQFLNRASYVIDLVQKRNLLFNLSQSLLETMQQASFIPGSPGSPSPAGTSSENMNDRGDHISPSTSFTAALLSMLGSFPTVDEDNSNIERLDSEINDLIFGMLENTNTSGGDSRHHGRSVVMNKTGVMNSVTHRYLLDRTSALVPPTLDPSHTVLSHRRYSVCISDMKCVLNVKGMARYFASIPISRQITSKSIDYLTMVKKERRIHPNCPLDNWIQTLSLAQQMDGHTWRPWVKGHVENEPKGWVGAFNASISLSSLFERLLNWDDSDPSPVHSYDQHLLSCVELTHYTLVGLLRWQRCEMLSYRPTRPPSRQRNPKVPEYALSPASLPFSTVASAHGTVLAMSAIPLPQIGVWSFHLPLHRFAASCIREVARRNESLGECGMNALFDMFSPARSENVLAQVRMNALLIRGLLEFPAIVLSRAAQIRAGIWKRNGPGMKDQVLNYSEPPFCRPLADADMILLQFAMLSHGFQLAGNSMDEKKSDEQDSMARLAFAGNGTARLVNILLHRFGLFDFLGFEKAPNTNIDRYINETSKGLYPREIEDTHETDYPSYELILPWTYCPASDPSMCMALVQELLHLIILLISEMPPPSPRTVSEHALEAKARLKREVIHRLASGNKTHSEMAEVSCALSHRDNVILGKTFVNPDDASGAALEDALNEVALRRKKSGAPDEWALRNEAWGEYDPAFHHISTRAHQSATENRPKPSSYAAFAPRPAPAHSSFKRIRRDLTADSCVLAIVYRVLHVHCYATHIDFPLSPTSVQGWSMYEEKTKSETVLARAVHLLTLGAYAWEDTYSSEKIDHTDWRDSGGGDLGSVFYNRESAPSARDWVAMALLRDPFDVMRCAWYIGKENTLTLLQKIASGTGDHIGFLGNIDPALRSGAAFLCKFASDFNSDAALAARDGPSNSASPTQEAEQEKKKNAAKEKAIATMKAQMAKFAADIGGGVEDEISMSEDTSSNSATCFSTPVRNRHTESRIASPTHSINSPYASPKSPYSPQTPNMTTPRTTKHNNIIRLMHERPRCIVCGGDSREPAQLDTGFSEDTKANNPAGSSFEGSKCIETALAFCGYSQASTVIMGGDRALTCGMIASDHFQSHVGVHITLCGHAIHKDCCDSYLKTVSSQRFDRIDGGTKREFRCPLCQRLSNCLVPFVDVAADWIERVQPISNRNLMQIDNDDGTKSSIHDFLSNSRWWATRNHKFVSWDGQCTFREKKEDKKLSESPYLSSPRQSFLRLHSKLGKKELISAWNSVLRTPRFVTRRSHSSSTDSDLIFTFDANEGTGHQGSNSDVLRKFIDQVSDVAYKADIRRLGEESLYNDFGEFRHYLSEKAVYNKDNRVAGKEMVDWPMCLSKTALTESRRQELSREKLISKMMFSIQAFTYTCCSETAEVRRHLLESSASEVPSVLSKFGVDAVSFGNDFFLLPEANALDDGGYQPFVGRFGKLRYLSLALMAATSPVMLEVVHLLMSFPDSKPDPFELRVEKKSFIKRAPVAFQILCSHVLTHTTGALIAVCGRARAEEGRYSINSVVDDCKHLVQLGFIARVSQVILARFRSKFLVDDNDWEQRVYFLIKTKDVMELAASIDEDERTWRHFGITILHILLSPVTSEPFNVCLESTDEDNALLHLLNAIDAAKTEAISFLREIAIICQILIPNIFCADEKIRRDYGDRDETSTVTIIKHYMELFDIDSPLTMLKSDLLQEIMKSWYANSTRKNSDRLDTPRYFQGMTWPVSSFPDELEIPMNCVPLLGNCFLAKCSTQATSPHISYLPKSYTDLYATLSELYPDCEQTAVCLVCGKILNAAGKGECSKHSYKCGGGAGIYFLVQECVGLIIHEQKAAYIHSPYVDYFGETPQYRGRPLNLNLDRYNTMRSLWSGHMIREKVIAERASTRQVIIPNFY